MFLYVRNVFLVFVLFLVVSVTPVSAVEISETTNDNLNFKITSLKTEISEVQELKDSLSDDVAALKNQGNKLKGNWYNPWKWGECKDILVSIYVLFGHMNVITSELKFSVDKLNGGVYELENGLLDLRSDMDKTAWSDAEKMSNDLGARLGVNVSPFAVDRLELNKGDLVQYKSQDKFYRYLIVSEPGSNTENVILEGVNGKKIEMPYSNLENRPYVKLVSTTPVDNHLLLQTTVETQQDQLNLLKQKINDLKSLKEYSTSAYVLFYTGVSITGLGVTLGTLGLIFGPATLGLSTLGLGILSAALISTGNILMGASYTLNMKTYLDKTINLEKDVLANENDLRYYNELSPMFEAYDMDLTVNMNQNLTGALNVTNNHGAEKACLIFAPENGTITFNGLKFIYTPLEGYTGNDAFQYKVLDNMRGVSNIATVKIHVGTESTFIVEDDDFPINVVGDLGDETGDGGTEDVNSFTPTSKIAFESITVLDKDVTEMNKSMHNMKDLVAFFTANNLNAVAVQITKEELQKGDIVQIKNSESAFLVYIGKNSNGNLLLEDLYKQFEYTPQAFDLLFTGNAILINHTPTKIKIIDGCKMTGDPITDTTILLGPRISGISTSETIKDEWGKAWQRQDFRDRAKNLVSKKTNNYDKVKAIFEYVRDTYNYDKHWNTKWSVNKVVRGKTGNCCELSRMEYCLTKAAIDQGLLNMTSEDYRFKKANCYFSGMKKTTGHVWVQFKVGPEKDPWQSADACSKRNKLGTHSGTEKSLYGYIYSPYLDW